MSEETQAPQNVQEAFDQEQRVLVIEYNDRMTQLAEAEKAVQQLRTAIAQCQGRQQQLDSLREKLGVKPTLVEAVEKLPIGVDKSAKEDSNGQPTEEVSGSVAPDPEKQKNEEVVTASPSAQA